jgi:hypothetical protein
VGNGVSADRAQKVWDNIALHTWDINLFRDTSRMMELGVLYDVLGVPDAGLDADDVVRSCCLATAWADICAPALQLSTIVPQPSCSMME